MMGLSSTLEHVSEHVKASSAMIEYVLEQQNHEAIREAAKNIGRNPRDLEVQVLLHLPRLMCGSRFPSFQQFSDEVERLADVMHSRVNPYADWRNPSATQLTNPRETSFVDVPEDEAHIIHERFHYLSSFRTNSFSYGLRTFDGRLASLVTLSQCDLEQIAAYLPHGIQFKHVLVLSRVFCFDWAPWNAVSYMMGQMYRRLREKDHDVKMLVTYINPNLGFRAASLRASNWVLFGYEEGSRYAYLNDNYITDRRLIDRFGTADPDILKRHPIPGKRFDASSLRDVQLDPLQLYAYFLDKDDYTRYAGGFEYVFRRP